MNQRTEDFEEVLWAAADFEYLDRDLRQIFSSYNYVMRQRQGRIPMEYKQFAATLNKLKTKSCGEIIVASRFDRRGWVAYRESMLRGYARMRAEARNAMPRTGTYSCASLPVLQPRRKSVEVA